MDRAAAPAWRLVDGESVARGPGSGARGWAERERASVEGERGQREILGAGRMLLLLLLPCLPAPLPPPDSASVTVIFPPSRDANDYVGKKTI